MEKKIFYTLMDENGANSIELPVLMAVGSEFEWYGGMYIVLNHATESDDGWSVVAMRTESYPSDLYVNWKE